MVVTLGCLEDSTLQHGKELVLFHDSPLGFENMGSVLLPQVGGDDFFNFLDGLRDVKSIDRRISLSRKVVMQV